MRVQIVRVGNSKGIRLPKSVLEQCGFKNEAELEVRDGGLHIKPVRRKAREGWEEAIAASIAQYGEDEELLLGDFPNEFDHTEWEW
jgi:antitoxin MazE